MPSIAARPLLRSAFSLNAFVDALYPTGGFGGDAPREIIDAATAFSGFPSFS